MRRRLLLRHLILRWAAVMFALEEIVGDLHAPVLGSVVLASATSWGVLRLILGNSPLFKVPQYQLVHPAEFAIYAVLGVSAGFVSVAFAKLLLGIRERFLRFPRWTVWFQPVAGGLLVGLMGWFVPQVMGVGYGYVGVALDGNMTLWLMALLVVLKLLTVTTSYASGNAGGIFGPALFIGAMLGGSLGTVVHHFFPAHTATPGAYALVGMGAAFAGIVRAPMTSVLMIFEMTQDYAVIVPLMIANLVSLFISSRFQKQPLYQALAVQDGVHLPSAESRQRRVDRQVVRVMRAANATLSADDTVREALEQVRSSGFRDASACGLLPDCTACHCKSPRWAATRFLAPFGPPSELERDLCEAVGSRRGCAAGDRVRRRAADPRLVLRNRRRVAVQTLLSRGVRRPRGRGSRRIPQRL